MYIFSIHETASCRLGFYSVRLRSVANQLQSKAGCIRDKK